MGLASTPRARLSRIKNPATVWIQSVMIMVSSCNAIAMD
jgi:hypothetical protein